MMLHIDIRMLALASAAAIAAVSVIPGHAQHAVQSTVCKAPAGLAQFAHPLNRTGRKLAEGKPLTILALGSSSTAGAGASSVAANYPSRLTAELKARFPLRSITMVNRGVNGAEMGDMLARLDASVRAEKPDLVLWQLGTNSLLRDRTISEAAVLINRGLDKIKATGADLILVNPQYAPKVLAKTDTGHMLDIISMAAGEASVNLFDRFAVMRHWRVAENIPFKAFLSPDELHMNDWSYACVAKLMGGAIAEAAMRPMLTATTAHGRN
jgi:lysophospholipase L1-like esterase